MYCPKCKQQVLGDICPNCGYKNAFRKMDDLSGNTASQSPVAEKTQTADPVINKPVEDKFVASAFKSMDTLAGEIKNPEVTVKPDIPAAGGFRSMDVLPGGKNRTTTDTPPGKTGDKPATGGFKTMDSLVSGGSNNEPGNKIDSKEVKPENFTNTVNRKRWLPAIAGVAVLVVVALILSSVLSNGLTRNQAEEILISALTASNANVQGEPELLEKIEQKNDFEVSRLTKGPSGYIAQVIVYSPDLYSIAKKLDENTIWQDDEDVRQALEKALDTAQTVQVQTSIYFLQVVVQMLNLAFLI